MGGRRGEWNPCVDDADPACERVQLLRWIENVRRAEDRLAGVTVTKEPIPEIEELELQIYTVEFSTRGPVCDEFADFLPENATETEKLHGGRREWMNAYCGNIDRLASMKPNMPMHYKISAGHLLGFGSTLTG